MEMHPVSTSNGSVAPLIAELRSGDPGLRDEAERRVRESDHPRPPSPARPPSNPMIAGVHDEPGPERWSRPPVERSARSFPRGAWRWGPGLVWTAVLLGGVLLRADDRPAAAPAPASDPFAVIRDRPLSAATWPLWREVYLRIFFDDNTDPVQDRMFHEQVRAFFTATVSASGGSLPKEFASDPIAWVVVASSHLHQAGDDRQGSPAREDDLTRAETASPRAIILGDPGTIASYTLATILISRGSYRGVDRPANGEMAPQLTEAEERLRHVEQVSPRVNFDLWRGDIARLRGDAKGAEALLRRSTDEHPSSPGAALAYLTTAMPAAGPSARLADLTGPFAGRFPKDASIQAIHAAALYGINGSPKPPMAATRPESR